ncbi:DNA topoisomerase III [Ruthenibacterium lactatiformans]|uniref:DNA topoisomerase n=1 Tax=Ruthenibacterium lactatiformans TaxID=1550024 RepID=A0A6I2U8W0_9FIRM|nr:type IA DNA topoisomerase [Ruthenibacterium lactatiformans]MST91355.1 DNA topoisomerase III [Ruthenibacterium lactatiformans]
MIMSKLVIAEKPSMGKTIASVLGADKRQDGFCEGNGYVVTWCFGFLSEFSEPEAYDEKYGKWRFDDLPIRPDVWQYTVMRDKKQQLDRIAALANRSDVTELVNACDAGREGERIFRNVYALIHCSKPVSRLWISSMEDEAIRRGFDDLKPGSDYDNLSFAADCRAKADWLVGINATRLFSVLYHRTLNVGRVMSPTLALIVQREAEIDGFKAEPFYTVNLDFGDYRAASEKLKAKETAEEVLRKCEGQAAVVRSVEQKEKTEKAPALYDLTTLQRDANRILGFTAQQTLDYVQALYEKKRCTYPRTDSRYLTDDMVSTVPAIALSASLICNLSIPSPYITGPICNSKKVSDHHAIVPTTGSTKVGLDELPAGELEILKLIARRVLVSLSEAHRYLETTVVMDCGGSTFTAKGKQVLSPGWRQYEKPEDNSSALPDISEGMELPFVDAALKEGKTTPPKRYTEDTLLAAMETAGSKEMPEDAERKGLGTPATRAETLEKLVSTGFVERKKNKKSISLVPSHSGISLVTVLPEQLQSPLLTAEWEYRLKEVERGELSPEQFLDGISDMVATLVQTYQPVLGAEVLFPSGRTVVGKCPRCGSDVTESKKGYFCERNDCRFGLWRDNRFLAGKKINLNKKVVSALLKDGRTFISGIYSERTGKNFDADLLMQDDGNKTSFSFEFKRDGKHEAATGRT